MNKLIFILVGLGVCSCSFRVGLNREISSKEENSLSKKVIAYYFIQDVNKGYFPKDMSLDFITHAIYSFVDISANGECSMINDRSTYTDRDEKIIKQFKEIKKDHPHLKTLFSIGGAAHSKRFSDISLTRKARFKFVHSCIELMKKYEFDGIDIDWEVVGFKTSSNPNSRPEDSENFSSLLKEFRAQLPKRALLSAAISPEPEVTEHLNLKVMGQNLDWIGVMDYALCGFWSKKSCHQSDYAYVGKSGIEAYLKAGIRPEQVILGVPFFGHYWRVESLENNGIGQKIIPPNQSHPYEDYVTYKDVKDTYLNKNGFHLNWDEEFNQPILVNSQDKIIISFDNERSLQVKANEVIKHGYGGMLIWEISEDDSERSLTHAISQYLTVR